MPVPEPLGRGQNPFSERFPELMRFGRSVQIGAMNPADPPGSSTSPVVIITQARVGSTRLPGKVLEMVAGKTLLEHHVDRLRRVRGASGIVVATTDQAADDPIVKLSAELGVACFRGSEADVLSRYAGAAVAHGAAVVVRVTSDCPLIEPVVVDQLITEFRAGAGRYDYVANFQNRNRTYPLGLEAEVFSAEALATAHAEAREPLDREHVTPFLWRQGDRFRLHAIAHAEDHSHHRWTVDLPEDLELVRRILENIQPGPPEYHMDQVLELLAQNPSWSQINREIQHKYYS